MKIAKSSSSAAKSVTRTLLCTLAAGLSTHAQPVHAQQLLLAEVRPATLPDAPSALPVAEAASSTSSFSSAGFGGQAQPVQKSASPTDKYIAPGQSAPSLTVGNKFVLGVKDAISPFSAIGWAISAGYAQGLDNSPNYGTDGKAFAQRFGASAARATSEGIFSDSIMASILHEDPRYYRMGPGHNFVKRAAYAATRTLITRTDGGKATPNFALLAGNLGGSYLTKTYYPALNQSNTEVLKTFGGSIGGSALGFAVSEFLSGALNIFHSSKPAAN